MRTFLRYLEETMKKTKVAVLVSLLASVPVCASVNSLDNILDAINKLENKKEPKCYATASRLEDFMFGTPLSDSARFSKNLLQKHYIELLWQAASKLAHEQNEEFVLQSHISQAQKSYFTVTQLENGHWSLAFPSGKTLTLNKNDKRQYESIAYSLRAVLAAQQDVLLSPDDTLLPLSDLAVEELKNSLDFYTLAALKVADNQAKANDERDVSDSLLQSVWLQLGLQKSGENQVAEKRDYAPIKSPLLKEMMERKLTSYASYNKVSNQVFLRNLQVYFARVTWPSDESEGQAIIDKFTQLVTDFSADLYAGAQADAMKRNASLISEEDVHHFTRHFIPHYLNEFEDVVFFPKLEKDQQVYMESYDMDAFRDVGGHWIYLNNAINRNGFQLYLEPDPFAAELLVENIAQYAVLLLRVAGNIVKAEDKEYLQAKYLDQAVAELDRKLALHNAAKDTSNASEALVSVDSGSRVTGALFADVTAQAGINYRHTSSDWLNRQLRSFIKVDESNGILTIPPAFGGSGIATKDINNDGLIDILVLGGRGNSLYINDGKGGFADKTQEFGLDWQRPEDKLPGESRQPIIADLDNDGWQDIIITYVNDSHRVYRNIEGKRFEDVTDIASLGGKDLVGGPATVFDYDNDGDLDVYITYFGNYIKGDLPTLKRHNANGSPNQLFENQGGFKFKNVTEGSGLDNRGWSQAVAHTDLNNDGWQDVIVGNDFGVNGYYLNQGDGTFTEVSRAAGTDKPSYTMGIGITDLNQDQLPDVYISNIVTMNKDESYILPNQDTRLKFNADKLANMRVVEANDLFISKSGKKALEFQASDKIGRGYSSTGWSWGASFFDADLDGDDDLYVLNGMNEFNLYSSKNPYYQDPEGNANPDVIFPVSEREQNVYFENKAGKLQNASKGSGLDILSNSRSAGYFDYDGDGDLDVVINNYHESLSLFRNNAEASHNNWLKVKLTGDPKQKVNADAIGARIYVTLPNGHKIWREIRGTDGYMSVNPSEQHFGLGQAKKVDVEVVWPNKKVQKFAGVNVNQRLALHL